MVDKLDLSALEKLMPDFVKDTPIEEVNITKNKIKKN